MSDDETIYEPPKPPVPDLPSDAELAAMPEPGEQDVDEYMDPEAAAADDTVDDDEIDEGAGED